MLFYRENLGLPWLYSYLHDEQKDSLTLTFSNLYRTKKKKEGNIKIIKRLILDGQLEFTVFSWNVCIFISFNSGHSR